MIALFVGKDYANNTIRNKICYGEKRLKIMGMTFLESAVICLAFAAVSVVSSLIFGSIFGQIAFTADFAPKFFRLSYKAHKVTFEVSRKRARRRLRSNACI